MFKRKEYGSENINTDCSVMNSAENINQRKTNSILRGSRLTGDILITYDLELDGDVEGNITSEQQSNVVIRGNCRGNIHVGEGTVTIEGKMDGGDIVTGGDVVITGLFNGGKIEAKGKVTINGSFNGTLTGREIEIGPDAQGTGDLLYGESISIARGARVELQIKKISDKNIRMEEMTTAEMIRRESPVQAVAVNATG